MNRLNAWWVGLCCLVLYELTRAPGTLYDEHVRLAFSVLHGHLNVDAYPPWEKVQVGGHYYILHPPLSAIVCLPFVWWKGIMVNQSMILILVGALAVGLTYKLTRSLWLTVFFGCGTAVWYEATLGASWGFCLILSTVPTLLALIELKDKARPAYVGIWAALAMLARYDLVFALPVYALMLRRHERRFWPFLLAPLAALGLYVAYNYARFGTVNDIALWLWFQSDPAGQHAHPGLGPFALSYLPTNLYAAFFIPPFLLNHFPWLKPAEAGQSLLFSSPGLLLTLRAPLRQRKIRLLWLALILSMGPSMLVYAWGYVQWSYRYAIQILPFAVALMAESETDQFARILISLSVAANAFALWEIRFYHWPT